MIISKYYHYFIGTNAGNGYFAGESDGIVTIGDDEIPSSRQIHCFDARTLSLVKSAWSLPNGRFLFTELSTEREYLLVARDCRKQYQPVGWDYRVPATGLSSLELKNLWQSWQ